MAMNKSLTIDHLFVIAGPSCCGKTTLVKQIKSNHLSALTVKIGLGDPDSWIFVNANNISSLTQKKIPRMVLHYALPSLELYSGNKQSYINDERLAVLERARKISIITLHTMPTNLVARTQKRKLLWKSGRRQLLRNIFRYFDEYKRLQKLERLYAKPEEIIPIYNLWFSYYRSYPIHSAWLLNVDKNPVLQPESDWSTITDDWVQDSSLITARH